MTVLCDGHHKHSLCPDCLPLLPTRVAGWSGCIRAGGRSGSSRFLPASQRAVLTNPPRGTVDVSPWVCLLEPFRKAPLGVYPESYQLQSNIGFHCLYPQWSVSEALDRGFPLESPREPETHRDSDLLALGTHVGLGNFKNVMMIPGCRLVENYWPNSS